MFLHSSYMHIVGNLFVSLGFADNIEAVAGNFRFMLFTGGGIAASSHVYLGSPATIAGVCCAPCSGCDTIPLCGGLILHWAQSGISPPSWVPIF